MKPMPPHSSAPGVGMSPCSPMPSPTACIQPSPRQVYSPSYMQGGLNSPQAKSPFPDQLDVVPLSSVQSIHGVPPVSRESTMQPVISLPPPCETFESYASPPQSAAMNTKEKDIMQIVEQLLSPVGATAPVSSSLAPYSCSEVLPIYTTSPCNPTSPEGPAPPGECHVTLFCSDYLTGMP